MRLELAGKCGIVTGASRGIGRAIALALAREGMRLALVARASDALDEAVRQTGSGDAFAIGCDLRQPAAPAAAVEAALARFGGLDLVVNCAGATKRGDFLALTDEEWNDGFALKFYAAMRLSRAAWPALRQSRGAIVNVIGVGGRVASAEFGIGGAVNSALINLTKCLADRGVQDGVRVNAVNPGGIATDRWRNRVKVVAERMATTPERAEQELVREMGVAAIGAPENVADVVAFMASPRAAYMQGAVVDVDGGMVRAL
ncbi:MAG: SDR family oxidoreductase [Reyranellaceae bacterium]